MFEFWLQLAVVLGCIMLGARINGIGIGLMCGLGICILTFGFHIRPSLPPINVLLIIITVVTMASTLHAAGGLDYLVDVAERILRKNPNHITLVAPLVTTCFTIFGGTAFVALSVLPVIAEVAYEAKVRPERPMSVAVVGAIGGIVASPMSAATAAMLVILSAHGIGLGQLMVVSIPSFLIGIFVAALVVYKKGLELNDDPEYKRRLEAGEIAPPKGRVTRELQPHAKLSVGMFAVVVLLIICFGTFTELLPSWQVGEKTISLSIPTALQIIMLGAAACMLLICKVKPTKIVNSPLFSAGMMGMMSICGVAWMTDTFFSANSKLIMSTFSGIVSSYPWTFSFILFFMSAVLMSQGATVPALVPLGLTLGISPAYLVAMYTAMTGTFFFPLTGPAVTATAFDRTGTTKIGKYVINHSYMLPGLVTTVVAVAVSFSIVWLFF
jgi:anaerobic C4-dicarboxylate transporter-like protein